MTRKNFSFRFEWAQAIAHLDPEQRLEIYEQTIAFAQTGKTDFKSETAAAAFTEYILPDFKRRAKAAEYRARARARKATQSETTVQPELPEVIMLSDVPEIPAPEAPIINRRMRRMMEFEEKRRLRKRSKQLRV